MSAPRLRCRANVWPASGWRSYQCNYAAKPDTTRLLSGRGTKGETLPVCGTHARTKHDPGAYWHNGSAYESPVAEYVR